MPTLPRRAALPLHAPAPAASVEDAVDDGRPAARGQSAGDGSCGPEREGDRAPPRRAVAIDIVQVHADSIAACTTPAAVLAAPGPLVPGSPLDPASPMATLIARHAELSLRQSPSAAELACEQAATGSLSPETPRVRDATTPTDDKIRELVMMKETTLRNSRTSLLQEDASLVPPSPLRRGAPSAPVSVVASPPISPRTSVHYADGIPGHFRARSRDSRRCNSSPAVLPQRLARLEATGLSFERSTRQPILKVKAILKEDGGPGSNPQDVLADYLHKTSALIRTRMHDAPNRLFTGAGLPKRTASRLSSNEAQLGCASLSDATLSSDEKSSTSSVTTEPTSKPTVFLFDWDDTLIPTTELRRSGMVSDAALSPGSAMRDHIRELEDIVVDLLEEASSYGSVRLITNATPRWMEASLVRLMPRVREHLQEAGISFISARRQYVNRFPGRPVKWKAEAFLAELRSLSAEDGINVVVLGDDMDDLLAGHHAAQKIGLSDIKVIKLTEAPTVEQLKSELRFITDHIETFARHQGSVDLSLEV